MHFPFYSLIILWYIFSLLFSFALLYMTPLSLSPKNFIYCFAFFLILAGSLSDHIVLCNKPLAKPESILKEFPFEWNSKIHVTDFLNYAKMATKSWTLYSLGNPIYQTEKWSWNYETVNSASGLVIILSLLFLLLKEFKSFYITLIFVSIFLCFIYSVFTSHIAYKFIKDKFFNNNPNEGIFTHTKISNFLISEFALDIPYMIITGPLLLWYSYTSFKN